MGSGGWGTGVVTRGALQTRRAGEDTWCETPMRFVVNDRWRGRFVVDRLGGWEITVEGWVDSFGTWRRGFTGPGRRERPNWRGFYRRRRPRSSAPRFRY